ncbi:hypothetical protein VNO80_25662 [Phaseolus coccineus]|uniref:FAD-binding domain-containing protein n=1 Tax=Phaseolus coccineus TaxID=3886 RepID=A0AAN9LV90_PHACN
MVGMALACFLASMPMTKQLNVAIIDSNLALGSGLHIKKEDPPDPRVSTVTTASISFLQDAGAIMQDSDFKTIIYPLRLSSMTLNTSSKSIVEENTKSVEPSSAQGMVQSCNLVMEVAYMQNYGNGPHPTSGLLGTRDMFSWFRMDATISTNEFFEIPPRVTKLASERMVFPLSLRHTNSYASKRVVLIGDAAHTPSSYCSRS